MSRLSGKQTVRKIFSVIPQPGQAMSAVLSERLDFLQSDQGSDSPPLGA